MDLEKFKKEGKKIIKKDAAMISEGEGDLVFFHTTRKGISHVGIYLANNKFVHASLNYGVIINDLNDDYYSHRFVRGGRAKIATGGLSAN